MKNSLLKQKSIVLRAPATLRYAPNSALGRHISSSNRIAMLIDIPPWLGLTTIRSVELRATGRYVLNGNSALL